MVFSTIFIIIKYIFIYSVPMIIHYIFIYFILIIIHYIFIYSIVIIIYNIFIYLFTISIIWLSNVLWNILDRYITISGVITFVSRLLWAVNLGITTMTASFGIVVSQFYSVVLYG